MKYRRFGKLNWNVSVLGFGAMRLPIIGDDDANIDEPEAIRMVRYAIDHGVNYLDTAYVYHKGGSEALLGKALKDGYRSRVKLATKMPVWLVKSHDELDKYFDEQLDRLQTGHVDFYLLHSLNRELWDKVKQLNALEWLDEKVAEGKIGHSGFSFHDKHSAFKEIVDGYEGWAFCQIQYNYLDSDYQAGTAGLEYAAAKGLAVVVMEPLAGGGLTSVPPKEIQSIWEKAKTKKSLAEWALRWVWNRPEVSVVLSGMSTMNQVVENVEIASRSSPLSMTSEELALVEKVKRKYKELGFIQCTGCRYCMPCPQGVNIPQILSLHNEFVRERGEEIKNKYEKNISPKNRAKLCSKCGKCEEHCPQKIPIRRLLSEAALFFEESG